MAVVHPWTPGMPMQPQFAATLPPLIHRDFTTEYETKLKDQKRRKNRLSRKVRVQNVISSKRRSNKQPKRKPIPLLNAYAERNKTLKTIGFNSYQEYLDSNLWKRIRHKAFRIRGNRCIGCGRKADTFHHSNYSNNTLKGKTLASLHPVCSNCHKHAERTTNGHKRSLEEANQLLGL